MAGGPYTFGEGANLQLDGSGSSDPEDETALTYEWDLDYDGFTFDVDASGVQPTVSFPDNFAPRMIGLRVTDSGDLSTIATASLAVTNVAPVLDAFLAASVDENGTVHLTGTYHDVGTQDTHTLTINWGEGASETVTVNGSSFDINNPAQMDGAILVVSAVTSFGTSFDITHQYLDDNPTNTASDVYTISVTLTDDDTDTATGSSTTITNDHHMVPPDSTRALFGLRHVAVEPDAVDVEFRRVSPREAGEGPTALDCPALALRVIPGNALPGHVRFELAIDPGAGRGKPSNTSRTSRGHLSNVRGVFGCAMSLFRFIIGHRAAVHVVTDRARGGLASSPQ